jgi:hypothetical protein
MEVESASVENNFEQQADEIEALQYIFSEQELIMITEKPYKFEIMINSNENEANNHIKMKLIFELPIMYPD